MTEPEFEHICRSEYHLSMVANRDGNYDRSCFGFYPHENSYDNLIPVIERTPNHILGLLNPEPNPNPPVATEPRWKPPRTPARL